MAREPVGLDRGGCRVARSPNRGVREFRRMVMPAHRTARPLHRGCGALRCLPTGSIPECRPHGPGVPHPSYDRNDPATSPPGLRVTPRPLRFVLPSTKICYRQHFACCRQQVRCWRQQVWCCRQQVRCCRQQNFVAVNTFGVAANKFFVAANKLFVAVNKLGVELNKSGVGVNKFFVELNTFFVAVNTFFVEVNKILLPPTSSVLKTT
jgi:hypothetical protein